MGKSIAAVGGTVLLLWSALAVITVVSALLNEPHLINMPIPWVHWSACGMMLCAGGACVHYTEK